jgi:hypothetical protein
MEAYERNEVLEYGSIERVGFKRITPLIHESVHDVSARRLSITKQMSLVERSLSILNAKLPGY